MHEDRSKIGQLYTSGKAMQIIDTCDFCTRSIKLSNLRNPSALRILQRCYTLGRTKIHRYEMRRESTKSRPETFKSYVPECLSHFPASLLACMNRSRDTNRSNRRTPPTRNL